MIKLINILKEEIGYRIYCDMDGVLVDFDRGYKELTGMLPFEAEQSSNVASFWEPINQAGAQWWAELKWMPDGKILWNHIKKYNPPLLSAPSKEQSSRIGKAAWVRRELPHAQLILKPADQKQQYATPNSILIDDKQKNIDQWNQSGGIGILHTTAETTIKELQKLGL